MLTVLKIYILQKKSSRISPFLIQMWQPTMLRILRVLCLSSRELVSQRLVEIWLKTFPWRNRKFPTSDLQQAARRRNRQKLSKSTFLDDPHFLHSDSIEPSHDFAKPRKYWFSGFLLKCDKKSKFLQFQLVFLMWGFVNRIGRFFSPCYNLLRR